MPSAALALEGDQSADQFQVLLMTFPDSKACPEETKPLHFWKVDKDDLGDMFEDMGFHNTAAINKCVLSINSHLLQNRESLHTVSQVYATDHMSTMSHVEFYQFLEDLSVVREYGITKDNIS